LDTKDSSGLMIDRGVMDVIWLFLTEHAV
jgi:hypothetical protein